MIDFTSMEIRKKTYAGANGNKIAVIYQGEQYMIKFPTRSKLNDNLSYANGSISEYIGCHIFDSVGIPAQETLLGTYRTEGKEYVVVACKDFTSPGIVLQDFASLKNTVVSSGHNGYGTELSEILTAIYEQNMFDPLELSDHFWDMFIVDAFIGNWDRHNGNWGFLYDTFNDKIDFAPVFDCGSCLFPQADETIMINALKKGAELDRRVYSVPLSSIKYGGKKINYFNFISSHENSECDQALARITPKIDMDKISEIIENTPGISDLQKRFYITVLTERKTKILDYSLSTLNKCEAAPPNEPERSRCYREDVR